MNGYYTADDDRCSPSQTDTWKDDLALNICRLHYLKKKPCFPS